RLTEIWAEIHPGQKGADAMDEQLHGERLGPRRTAPLETLPDGTFVLDDGVACLVMGSEFLRWTPAGYLSHRAAAANERAEVITPPSLVALLERDWEPLVPLLHPSAGLTRRAI